MATQELQTVKVRMEKWEANMMQEVARTASDQTWTRGDMGGAKTRPRARAENN